MKRFVALILGGFAAMAASARTRPIEAQQPVPLPNEPLPMLEPLPSFGVGSVLGGGDADANVQAFLSMIRFAEGTADPLGYRALFGHTPRRPRAFDGFADHPRIASQFTDSKGRRLWTSAAGAYQFMAVSPIPGGGSTKVNTWDRIRDRLRLPDFSPASQDAGAIELIRERGALDDVRAGRVAAAVAKVAPVWASLPGAGYDQPERAMGGLVTAYVNAGGFLA